MPEQSLRRYSGVSLGEGELRRGGLGPALEPSVRWREPIWGGQAEFEVQAKHPVEMSARHLNVWGLELELLKIWQLGSN